METAKITRAALGSTASLGDLYDARRDDFSGISIFKSVIPASAITLLDADFQDTRLVHSDNFSEKATKLDVSAELQVSVLAGLFRLEGSGQYLSDQKQSARTVKSSLVHNIKTKDEFLNIYHDDLRKIFAIDAIESRLATHVVVGISWGANSILSCVYENKENRDVRDITGSLSSTLKNAALSITGGAEIDITAKEKSDREKFEIHVYGDILSKDRLPTTFETALELMAQVPALVKYCNDGKGKPLMYHLLPVSLLQSYLKFTIGADMMIRSLETTSLTRVVKMFEHMSEAQRKVNDFYQDALDNSYCVVQEDLEDIVTLQEEIAIEETSFRVQLSEILQKIRSGKSDVDRLEKFLKKMQTSNWSASGVSTKLSKWVSITEKIHLARALAQHGAKYIGVGSSLEEEILENFDDVFYVLYFTHSAKDEEPDRWKCNRQIFFQAMKKESKGHKYFAVDCDIHPRLKIGNHFSCVQTMQSGAVLVEDLLADQQKTLGIPLVQLDTGRTARASTRPDMRVPLEIPCTGHQCNPTPKYQWKCNKCLTVVEFASDDYVYCVCGKIPIVYLEFKCPDPKHGVTFKRHDESVLNHFLSGLRTDPKHGFEKDQLTQLRSMLSPCSELNILILGESGVGKSTWINGFINFVKFKSLEKAEKSDLVTPIPSQFSVYNEDYQELVVRTRTQENQILPAGHSATQEAKVYPFTVGNTIIRLIDTPAIGDTRGVEQDKKNVQNILATLSHYDKIHGICILLKANNTRLTVMFRYCIKQLLTYLHRDASKNIMFCFTNSRGTYYRPDETLSILKEILKQNTDVEIPLSTSNVYCFDSEPYRFLAAVKNNPPVAFRDVERENSSKGWEKSIEEILRMLKHIMSLKPHSTMSTLSLNNARKLVSLLARQFVETSITRQKIKSVLYQMEETGYNNMEGINLSRRTTMFKMIEEKKKEIQEYNDELRKIEQCSARFAYYLKRNAIVTYADATEQYLHYFIREEEENVSRGWSRAVADDLKMILETYMKEKQLLEMQKLMNGSENVSQPGRKDKELLVKELQHLKHSGRALKEALEGLMLYWVR